MRTLVIWGGRDWERGGQSSKPPPPPSRPSVLERVTRHSKREREGRKGPRDLVLPSSPPSFSLQALHTILLPIHHLPSPPLPSPPPLPLPLLSSSSHDQRRPRAARRVESMKNWPCQVIEPRGEGKGLNESADAVPFSLFPRLSPFSHSLSRDMTPSLSPHVERERERERALLFALIGSTIC